MVSSRVYWLGSVNPFGNALQQIASMVVNYKGASVGTLVSIVLPTHNGARYLDESIRSCLAQTYTNWELIIVDDASTDNTAARIAHYVASDPRIRSMRHERNRRLPAALNTGFREARGSYLTWTSDDNAYRANALEEMVAYLEAHPDVDVVYSDYTEIDENGSALKDVCVGTPQTMPLQNWVGPCFLYRETVQKTLVGYTEDAFLAEDYDFWLRAAAVFQLKRLPRNLYRYRVHSASLTALKRQPVTDAILEVIRRNIETMQWLDKKHEAEFYWMCAALARRRRHFVSALCHLVKVLCLSPGVAAHRSARSVEYRFFGPKTINRRRSAVGRSSRS
jgi:glycosyltransferase involved in cell wall biosynthesis